MIFVNKTNCKIFDDFAKKYSKFLDTFLPEVTVNIINPQDSEVGDADVMILFCTNPVQSYPNYFSDKHKKNIDEIIYKHDVKDSANNPIHLSDEQLEALIAHELGHFDHDYKQLTTKGLDEEKYCDQFAKNMGYIDDLKDALTALKNLPGVNQADLQSRINSL